MINKGYRLEVFQNRVLGRIFGCKRNEIARGLRFASGAT
jgi:hypothetical protein